MKPYIIATLSVLFFFLKSCASDKRKALKVLLVGNSSIYYNNMPRMLEVIASENGFTLETKLIANGGYTLRDHLNDGQVEKALDSLDWDFVVLNEQSTLGENYLVKGFPRVRESYSFYETVKELDSKIKTANAKTVIISLYPRKNAPMEDGAMLDYSYMKIAKELGIELSPVSYTWKEVLETKSDWKLYRADNLHPTPLGSYVTANVIFTTITDQKSKPIDKEIFGSLIDEFDGTKTKDSLVSLIKTNTAQTQAISEIVYRNIKRLHDEGGYYQLEKPK